MAQTPVPAAAIDNLLQLLAIAAADMLATVSIGLHIHKGTSTTVNNQSIREGLDHLPTGLCCSTEDGLVLLSNVQMDRLCLEVTGESLLNADRFWGLLVDGAPQGKATRVEQSVLPTFQLEDGTVWIFTQSPIEASGDSLRQLLAYEVTEAFQLGSSLRATNEQLTVMNERIGSFGSKMVEIVRNEEILRAKTRIHDQIGQALMATRLHLAGHTSQDFDEKRMLMAWKSNVALLRNESEEKPLSPAAGYLQEAGKAIGIDIAVEGELPVNDEAAMRTLNAGARECMTNAVRHAKARNLTISVIDCGAWWKMSFENDGKPPEPNFHEGGGLGGLRRMVEDRGGVMITHTQRHFKVQLLVPKSSLSMDQEA